MQAEPFAEYPEHLAVLRWLLTQKGVPDFLTLPRLSREVVYWSSSRAIGPKRIRDRSNDLLSEYQDGERHRGPRLAQLVSREWQVIDSEIRNRATSGNPRAVLRNAATSLLRQLSTRDAVLANWRDLVDGARQGAPLWELQRRAAELRDIIDLRGGHVDAVRQAASVLSRLAGPGVGVLDPRASVASRLLRAQQLLLLVRNHVDRSVWIGYDRVMESDFYVDAGPIQLFTLSALESVDPRDERLPRDFDVVSDRLRREAESGTRGRVFARVSVPDDVPLDRTVEWASMLVRRSLRAFLGGNYPGWRETGPWFRVYGDQVLASFDNASPEPRDFMWDVTDTKPVLGDYKEEIGRLASEDSAELDAIFYTLEAVQDSANLPPATRLLVSVRTIEWVSASVFGVGRDNWTNFMNSTCGDAWALGRIGDVVQLPFWLATSTEDGLNSVKSDYDVTRVRDEIIQPAWDGLELKLALASDALTALAKAMREGTIVSAAIADAAKFKGPPASKDAVASLRKEFKIISARVHRCRDSVAHGGDIPVSVIETVADLVRDFAIRLISRRLSFLFEALQDEVQHFEAFDARATVRLDAVKKKGLRKAYS